MEILSREQLVLVLWTPDALQLYKELQQVENPPAAVRQLKQELLRAFAGRRLPHDE